MKRKSTYKEICKLTLAAAAIGVFSASAAEAVEIKDVLDSYVEATVLPTYSQMSDSAIEFNKAVAKLKESASDENLAKAAAAWSKVQRSLFVRACCLCELGSESRLLAARPIAIGQPDKSYKRGQGRDRRGLCQGRLGRRLQGLSRGGVSPF